MIISSPIDFREAARRRTPRFLFDYAEGGANNELTLARNVSDLAEVTLAQQVLRGVGEVDLTASLFGTEQFLPVILGPVGIAGMFRRRGEVQAARAAFAAGVPFCLSTVSLCSRRSSEERQCAAPLVSALRDPRSNLYARRATHSTRSWCRHPGFHGRYARAWRQIPRCALRFVGAAGTAPQGPAGPRASQLGLGDLGRQNLAAPHTR